VREKSYVLRARWLYSQTVSRARERGIPWKFTFAKWLRWWERRLGPDWMQLRGKRRGQFQMARRGDRGDYEPRNVECITVSQNLRDQHVNDRAESANAKRSVAQKRRWLDPKYRAKMRAALRRNRAERNARNSAAMKRRWRDPKYRAKISAARQRGRAKMSATMKRKWRLRRLVGRWDVSALYREQKARRADTARASR
jgi:hypothetical protein